MREPYLLPEIFERDYTSLRSLMPDQVPETYSEWRQLMARRSREETEHGFEVRTIYVDPAEFGRFCKERGQPYNNARLLDFITEKDAGKRF